VFPNGAVTRDSLTNHLYAQRVTKKYEEKLRFLTATPRYIIIESYTTVLFIYISCRVLPQKKTTYIHRKTENEEERFDRTLLSIPFLCSTTQCVFIRAFLLFSILAQQ